MYEELGSANLSAVSLSLLLSHPVLQEVIAACTTYKAVVSHSLFLTTTRLLERKSIAVVQPIHFQIVDGSLTFFSAN